MVSWTIRQSTEARFFEHYHMSRGTIFELMEFVIQEVNLRHKGAVDAARNSGIVGSEAVDKLEQDMKMTAECWDKDVEDYSYDWRFSLEEKVDHVALPWCINRLNTLESMVEKFHQEIHRLSSPSNEQGKAE